MAEPGKTTVPKVIIVFGATGQQGGSVAKALKDDHRFKVKAATRNPNSDKAKKLASEGVEVIKADLDDPASLEGALRGAYGVFLVTTFLEAINTNQEVQQGKNVVDAAKKTGIQHLVFSGLKSVKERIGKDGCTHFESKKVIYDYIVEQGVPYTVVDFAFFYENFTGALKAQKNEKGEFVLEIPVGSAPLDTICISESGEVVHQILARGEEFKGRWVALASHTATIAEYAAILSKALKTKKFVAGTLTPEQYAKLGFPLANDFAVMFQFFASGKNEHDIALTRKLHPGIPTFEQWVEKNRDTIEAAFQ